MATEFWVLGERVMAEQDGNRRKFTVLANGFRIQGEGTLLPGARVTDYLNNSKAFLALTHADVWHVAQGRKLMEAPFLNINRGSIEVVIPDDAPAPGLPKVR
jgi:hypothetical protein